MSKALWIGLGVLLLAAPAQAEDAWAPANNKAIDAFNTALGHINQRRLGPAEANLKKCLRADPGAGMCEAKLADVWIRKGDLDPAVTLLTELSARFPKEVGPLTLLAFAHFSGQRFDEAAQWSGKALEVDPHNLEALSMHQVVLVRQGRYDEMLALINAAREAGPKPEHDCLEVTVRLQRDHADGARKLLKSCREADDSSLITNAESAFTAATGERTTGGDALVELMDTEETDIDRAIAAFNEQDWAAAEKACTKAAKDDKGRTQALIVRAQARFEMGKTVAALKDLDDALTGGTWVDVHKSGVLSGIVTKRAEENLLAMLHEGAATQVLLLSKSDRLADAETALGSAREAFGNTADLMASEAWLRLGQGDAPAAWTAALASLASESPPAAAINAISKLAIEHPLAATPDQRTLVFSQGRLATRYNLAAGLSNNGQAEPCLTSMRPLAGSPETAPERLPEGTDLAELQRLQGSINGLAHGCAVTLADVAAATELFPLLGPPGERDAWNVVNHAILMIKNQRPEDAWQAVSESGLLEKADDPNRASVLQIAVGAALDTGRLDDAARLATDPQTPPNTRLNAATELGGAGRKGAALSILKATCPELSGKAREVCDHNAKVFAQ